MKNIKLLAGMILGSSIIISACSENNDMFYPEKSAVINSSSSSCTYTGELTDAEIAGLMEMREEEKLARDVYISLFDTYQYQVFSNISKSEDSHMAAVLNLIDGYGLTDPALAETGQFSNPVFTDLYSQLISQSTSLTEALKTGAFIEEYDIADLKKLITETQNTDVLNVYSNLLAGSENHLRAFVNSLSQQGIEYTPQILESEEYLEILSASNSNGKGNQQNMKNNGAGTSGGACDGSGQPVNTGTNQGTGNRFGNGK